MDQSNRTYDILIIGGGAVGCAVARELSRSQRSVALVEKEADVAAGTSGRNSAVVHAGFNNRPGSLMAQLCVEGNQGFAALCRQLEVPYRKTGKLLVAFDQEDLAVLRRLLAQGEANGCRGLHLLDQAQLGAFLPQVGGIGAYAGLRPKLAPPGEGGYRDFVIREDKPGFVNLVGIESPGLTASLPIARRVAALVGGSLDLSPRADFQAHRRGIRRFRDQSPAAQAALIAADPDYGEVVCRCQTVTRAELRQAVENPLGVRTLAGIKYRAWATTGRCQGGYCLPKIAQMLVEDYGLAPEDVTYRGEGSPLFAGRVK